MDKVIVIGTGVFGLSTVDHILRRSPAAQLTIISQPSPLAPSDDFSKIVRVDYPTSERMTEAVETQEQWNNSSSFSKFQHRIGRIIIFEPDDTPTLEKINTAREEHGLERRQPGDSTLMRDAFGKTVTPDPLTYVLAPDDSIVDWKACMYDARERAKKACTDSGGIFYESGVATIVKGGTHITALILQDGERIETNGAQIVLAVGPWLAQVLAASGINLPPNGRTPVATGLFSYAVQLNDEQVELCRNKPMVSHGGKAEFLPPADGGSVGKVTWIHPFTNLRGSTLSRVEDLSGSYLAKSHKHKAIGWMRKYLPVLKGARIISTTSFWDGVTETQDPIIARHPEYQNLVCAAGGSFNRAKDLPTIGSHVTAVLSGQHVPDRYSWEPERSFSHRDHIHLVPRGDFATMEEEARQDGQVSAADHLSLAVI